MRNWWYGDKRDLVKWSVLIHLADMNTVKRILQIAYLQASDFPKVEIDKEEKDMPKEVQTHFRDIRNIEALLSPIKVSVFSKIIVDRKQYLREAKEFISLYQKERCVVFLDPDTGLEPARPSLKHVLKEEAREFWKTLRTNDLLALYQHETNKAGRPWEETKRIELEKAIGAPKGSVMVGRSLKVAKDVVLFYAKKT
jgi:hypothetical protein